MPRRAAAVAAGLLLGLALGCASAPRDPLEAMHPIVLPWREEVVLLACRWTTDRPVGVSLPADARAEERRALDAALAAWARAGLGVRLLVVQPEEAQIAVDLADDPVVREGGGSGSGRTVADCRVDPQAGRAELVAAQVALARTVETWRGKRRALAPEELAGAALHELGHALGFQGHARGGVMAADPQALPRLGRAALRGEGVDPGPLAALYARPPGAVLRRVAVSRWRTDLVDRLAALAAREGLEGPFARTGDLSARVFFRDPRGVEYGVAVPNLEETLGDPTRILVLPEARTRAVLPRARDLPPEDATPLSP